jgi:hypothetical protein
VQVHGNPDLTQLECGLQLVDQFGRCIGLTGPKPDRCG